jgi:hypothetical protein
MSDRAHQRAGDRGPVQVDPGVAADGHLHRQEPRPPRFESAKLSGVEAKRHLLVATRAALADRTAVTLPCDLVAGS